MFSPDFPFSPARFRFFYGWAIAVVATIAVWASIPGQTMGVSVFTDSLLAATGLSRVQLSATYLVGTLLSGTMLPSAGNLLDRFGARVTIVVASVALALTLVYLASVDWIIAAMVGVAGLRDSTWVAIAVLVFGFFGLRLSGQGVLTLVGRTLIGRWFDRLRGIVTGVQGPFISVGFAMAPLVLAQWIEASGWRGAWLEMALLIGVGMSFLGWLVYRESPEPFGLRMDGRAPRPSPAVRADGAISEAGSEAKSEEGEDDEPEYSRKQALRTLAFWAFTLGLATQGLNITGITFHIVDLGRSEGLSQTASVAIFPFIAATSVSVALLVGWLTNRVRLQWLLVLMMGAQAVGVAAIGHFGDPVYRVIGILGMGVSGGCFGPLSSVPLPRFFGRTHLGAITSTMMMWIVWGSALGPIAMAESLELFGSYRPALYLGALLPCVAIVLALLARTPARAPAA